MSSIPFEKKSFDLIDFAWYFHTFPLVNRYQKQTNILRQRHCTYEIITHMHYPKENENTLILIILILITNMNKKKSTNT